MTRNTSSWTQLHCELGVILENYIASGENLIYLWDKTNSERIKWTFGHQRQQFWIKNSKFSNKRDANGKLGMTPNRHLSSFSISCRDSKRPYIVALIHFVIRKLPVIPTYMYIEKIKHLSVNSLEIIPFVLIVPLQIALPLTGRLPGFVVKCSWDCLSSCTLSFNFLVSDNFSLMIEYMQLFFGCDWVTHFTYTRYIPSTLVSKIYLSHLCSHHHHTFFNVIGTICSISSANAASMVFLSPSSLVSRSTRSVPKVFSTKVYLN